MQDGPIMNSSELNNLTYAENLSNGKAVYTPGAFPAIVLPLAFIALLCILCGLFFLSIVAYTAIQTRRQKQRERKNRELQRKLLKERIEIMHEAHESGFNVNKSCLKRLPSLDNEEVDNNDQHPLLMNSGPCALEEQIAKLSELAEEHIRDQQKEKKVTIQIPAEVPKWFLPPHSFDVPMLFYLYVFFTYALAMEVTYGRFLYAFAAKCDLHFSLMEGSFLMTLFWAAVILSRLLALPLSRVLTPNAIMISCLTLNLICPIVLLTYGQKYPTFLWLFSGLVGFALGPIIPGGFTWANVFLTRAPKSMALCLGFGAFGAALLSWIAGFLLDFLGYESLMYLSIATASIAMFLYMPVMVIHSKGSWYRLKPKLSPEPKRTVQVSYI